MKKNRIFFEMEIDVLFDNEEMARAYFIEGDWKKTFWALDDLDDLSKSIAHGFYNTESRFDKNIGKSVKFIEGFGVFINQENGMYKTDDFMAEEIGGHISINCEIELHPASTISLDK